MFENVVGKVYGKSENCEKSKLRTIRPKILKIQIGKKIEFKGYYY